MQKQTTSIMRTSIIEWDKEDKLLQHQSFTNSSCATSRSWNTTTSRSISSISIFPDEKNDFQDSPIIHAQAPPTILMEVHALLPLTESEWNLGVDEFVKVVGSSDLSAISMRRIMDLDFNPECRREAFQCLRRLDEWSDEVEQREGTHKNTQQQKRRRNLNSSFVRIKGSQLRRRLFSGDRESSFIMG